MVPVFEICEPVCGISDLLISADIVYIVTGQFDVCYLTWGWRESNEGDVVMRFEGGGILLMHSLISPLIDWLICS